MYHKSKTVPVIFTAIILSTCCLAMMAPDQRYIAGTIFTCSILVLWLWMKLWNNDKVIPFFDIGFFCAASTLLYIVYPLANYWADGFQFGILGDSRLQNFHILPKELFLFHLRHVLYLFSFVVMYSIFRGKKPICLTNIKLPKHSSQVAVFYTFLLLTAYFLIINILTGLNYNISYAPEEYQNNLSLFYSLPLLVVQISTKLAGILFLFKLACLFIVVSKCKQRKWYIVLIVWITAEIIQAITIKGSRTGLVLFLIATALYYHRLIKPLSIKFLVISGGSLLAAFIFMGVYRSFTDIADFHLQFSVNGLKLFSGNNEFQVLLGTAYDVLRLKNSGVHFPWYLYINDIINILPPQQLLPFEKIPASEWYLRQIGLSKTGIGLMWGVISQSIIGGDWIELALRGAILGYILAKIHRWYIKHQSEFIATLVYVYLCLRVYYTFRSTTLSLLTNLIWELIPFLILLKLGSTILSTRKIDKTYTLPLNNPSIK